MYKVKSVKFLIVLFYHNKYVLTKFVFLLISLFQLKTSLGLMKTLIKLTIYAAH